MEKGMENANQETEKSRFPAATGNQTPFSQSSIAHHQSSHDKFSCWFRFWYFGLWHCEMRYVGTYCLHIRLWEALSILKLEASFSSERLLPTYQSAWCHTPDDYNMNFDRCANFKLHSYIFMLCEMYLKYSCRPPLTPPHIPYGLCGLPSRLWSKCNRLLKLGRPWGAVKLFRWGG
jgi:hypothetical protein